MKPHTNKEAHLRRKFKLEEEIQHDEERGVREDKRIWKRQTHKVDRNEGKQQIRRFLKGDDE